MLISYCMTFSRHTLDIYIKFYHLIVKPYCATPGAFIDFMIKSFRQKLLKIIIHNSFSSPL